MAQKMIDLFKGSGYTCRYGGEGHNLCCGLIYPPIVDIHDTECLVKIESSQVAPELKSTKNYEEIYERITPVPAIISDDVAPEFISMNNYGEIYEAITPNPAMPKNESGVKIEDEFPLQAPLEIKQEDRAYKSNFDFMDQLIDLSEEAKNESGQVTSDDDATEMLLLTYIQTRSDLHKERMLIRRRLRDLKQVQNKLRIQLKYTSSLVTIIDQAIDDVKY